LYIQKTILYVDEKSRYVTNDQIHTYDTRIRLISAHQRTHKFELDSESAVAGSNFCNKLPTYIKHIRNNCHFKRKLQGLIKGCYYSVEECMNNDFINIGF